MNYLISSKGRSRGDSVKEKYYNNDNDSCFVNIDSLAPVQVAATKGMRMHLLLTVADTWCDRAGDGAWFGIKVGDKVVTKGLYTTAAAGQRVPITLQTVFETKSDGAVAIQAVWCNWSNASTPCYIGEWGDAVLTVGLEDIDLSKQKEILGRFSGSSASDLFHKG